MTFDVMSIPNQMMSRGASAMRGMLFKATRNGSMIFATISHRASKTPVMIPASEPSPKPSNISMPLT